MNSKSILEMIGGEKHINPHYNIKVEKMTKEELWNEAKIRVDAFIDTLSQDIRGTLYDRLNQEDVKDFLYGLYIDSAEPREKRIEELETRCTELFLQNNEFAERFEKSIEIIKELVRVEYADFTNGDYSNELSKVLEQAEQFLKEIEK